MPLYTVQFPTPKGCWSDLTRNYNVAVTIISFAWVGYRRYIALVKVEGGGVQGFLRDVERCDSTQRLSIYSKNRNGVVFEIHATRVMPLHIFASAEILMLSPILIKRGMVTARIYSNSKAINFLLDSLRKIGYPFQIHKDASAEAYSGGLTRKQKYILKKAIEYGYYSYPRRITLTQLAERLNLSKSYLSETLQIIESKLIRGNYF